MNYLRLRYLIVCSPPQRNPPQLNHVSARPPRFFAGEHTHRVRAVSENSNARCMPRRRTTQLGGALLQNNVQRHFVRLQQAEHLRLSGPHFSAGFVAPQFVGIFHFFFETTKYVLLLSHPPALRQGTPTIRISVEITY